MKKSFPCGHVGKGRFCHRCIQEAQSQLTSSETRATHNNAKSLESFEARTSRAAARKSDKVDLSALDHLPSMLVKARTIIDQVMQGVSHASFGGKRLASTGNEAVSVPVGHRYRLIFVGRPLRPLELLSHESYNGKYVD